MFWKRIVIALAAAHLLIAMKGSAQEFSEPTGTFAEFGRASGGEMQATIKQPSRFSGSLGLTSARSSSFFGGRGNTYGATLGGTLLRDKAWFFGTAERTDGLPIGPSLSFNAGQGPTILGYGTMNSLLGDRQSLVASASRGASPPTVPASFLSLHYTGILSSNMFFTARVARQSSEILPGFLTSVPNR